MRKFIVSIFTTIGVLTSLFILTIVLSLYYLKKPSLVSLSSQDNVVLTLTLGEKFLEEKPEDGRLISYFKGRSMSVHTVISGINHAASDKGVKGIFLNLEGTSLKAATTQELRDALKAFKETGKFIYTYTDTFGDFSNGTTAYYLAAVTSKIWVMPLGEFNFNGMLVEVPFGKKALQNLKINPQFGRREEYKGMVESLTEENFSPPYRQNLQRILDVLTTQIIKDVASDRNLKVPDVTNMLNTAPHTLKEAQTANMIDAIGYKDEVKDEIEKTLNNKPVYVDFERYTHEISHPSHKNKIAIVYAEGTISKGKMAHNPLSDEAIMDAVEVAKEIRHAGDDADVKAIVLRIDSGGGYPIPCELIDREIKRLKSKKPVIVSMANYAASGGYWIASNARKIVALPATLTGSIGVYAGKLVTQEFWNNYGLNWGEIHSGNNAQIWSTGQDFTEVGRQKFEAYLDKIYTVFQEKVVTGRNMTPEAVHAIAKGQVWTGTEAKENGLVDELGGLTTAIAIAKQEAGMPKDAPVTIQEFPLPKSIFEFVFDRHQPNEVSLFARYPSLRILLQQFDSLFAPAKVDLKMNSAKP